VVEAEREALVDLNLPGVAEPADLGDLPEEVPAQVHVMNPAGLDEPLVVPPRARPDGEHPVQRERIAESRFVDGLLDRDIDRGDLSACQFCRRVDVSPGVPSCSDDADPRLIHRQRSAWPRKSARADFRGPEPGSYDPREKLWDRGIIPLSPYPFIPMSRMTI